MEAYATGGPVHCQRDIEDIRANNGRPHPDPFSDRAGSHGTFDSGQDASENIQPDSLRAHGSEGRRGGAHGAPGRGTNASQGVQPGLSGGPRRGGRGVGGAHRTSARNVRNGSDTSSTATRAAALQGCLLQLHMDAADDAEGRSQFYADAARSHREFARSYSSAHSNDDGNRFSQKHSGEDVRSVGSMQAPSGLQRPIIRQDAPIRGRGREEFGGHGPPPGLQRPVIRQDAPVRGRGWGGRVGGHGPLPGFIPPAIPCSAPIRGGGSSRGGIGAHLPPPGLQRPIIRQDAPVRGRGWGGGGVGGHGPLPGFIPPAIPCSAPIRGGGSSRGGIGAHLPPPGLQRPIIRQDAPIRGGGSGSGRAVGGHGPLPGFVPPTIPNSAPIRGGRGSSGQANARLSSILDRMSPQDQRKHFQVQQHRNNVRNRSGRGSHADYFRGCGSGLGVGRADTGALPHHTPQLDPVIHEEEYEEDKGLYRFDGSKEDNSRTDS